MKTPCDIKTQEMKTCFMSVKKANGTSLGNN